MTSTTPSPILTYHLRISLAAIEPPIWRQITVPADITLFGLHQILQVVMGWECYHLHEFQVGEKRYGVPDPSLFGIVKDDRQVRLRRIAKKPGAHFTYLYDFGDGWLHDVVVERIEPMTSETVFPRCHDGERACPPEDCGGFGGYGELVKALGNSEHPEHQRLRQWAGKHYDPELFSLQAVNSALAMLTALILSSD